MDIIEEVETILGWWKDSYTVKKNLKTIKNVYVAYINLYIYTMHIWIYLFLHGQIPWETKLVFVASFESRAKHILSGFLPTVVAGDNLEQNKGFNDRLSHGKLHYSM